MELDVARQAVRGLGDRAVTKARIEHDRVDVAADDEAAVHVGPDVVVEHVDVRRVSRSAHLGQPLRSAHEGRLNGAVREAATLPFRPRRAAIEGTQLSAVGMGRSCRLVRRLDRTPSTPFGTLVVGSTERLARRR